MSKCEVIYARALRGMPSVDLEEVLLPCSLLAALGLAGLLAAQWLAVWRARI